MVEQFGLSEQIGSQSESVRALIRIGLAANPSSGAEIAARQRAYNETKTWAIRRLIQFLNLEMKRELEVSVKGAPEP